MRTSNPALSDRVFEAARPRHASDAMTIQGAVNKAALSLLITAGVAYWAAFDVTAQALLWPALIGGLIVALITMFKPTAAPVTTPIYAALEGLVLGAVSAAYAQQYAGIVPQAVGLTFATLFVMLSLYRTGAIKATPVFKKVLVTATAGIFVFYLVSIILSLFGVTSAGLLHGTSPLSIGISLVIVGVAAFNLILDFDMIENAARSQMPRYMEWYGAFALLVTLVWLYLEILRLLSKLQSRD